jgi:hypothetical protein
LVRKRWLRIGFDPAKLAGETAALAQAFTTLRWTHHVHSRTYAMAQHLHR